MPSGSEFLNKTIFHKNTDMYDALKKFYKNKVNNEYTLTYSSDFLFKRNSITFKKMLGTTARYVIKYIEDEKYIEYKNFFIELAKLENYDELESDEAKKINNITDIIYDIIIENCSEKKHSMEYYELCYILKVNLRYYGAIEKDFSTIINPKIANKRFWRLINFYWSAFFILIEKMIDNVYKYELYNEIFCDSDIRNLTSFN